MHGPWSTVAVPIRGCLAAVWRNVPAQTLLATPKLQCDLVRNQQLMVKRMQTHSVNRREANQPFCTWRGTVLTGVTSSQHGCQSSCFSGTGSKMRFNGRDPGWLQFTAAASGTTLIKRADGKRGQCSDTQSGIIFFCCFGASPAQAQRTGYLFIVALVHAAGPRVPRRENPQKSSSSP